MQDMIGVGKGYSGLPVQDRPRERLANIGPRSLAVQELLAILISPGTRRASAFEVAGQVLADAGEVCELSRKSLSELRQFHGLGEAKAARLVAAFELARRMHAERFRARPLLDTPARAGELLGGLFSGSGRELFGILILDSKNHYRSHRVITSGILNAALIHPREVFREAILERAASVILFHTHPSGDPTPSRQDQLVTDQIVRAGWLMEIAVLDHIIIGEGAFFSFRQEGLMEDPLLEEEKDIPS